MEGNEEADGRHDEKNPTRNACEAQRLFEDSEGPAGEAAHERDPVLEHRGQMLLNCNPFWRNDFGSTETQ